MGCLLSFFFGDGISRQLELPYIRGGQEHVGNLVVGCYCSSKPSQELGLIQIKRN